MKSAGDGIIGIECDPVGHKIPPGHQPTQRTNQPSMSYDHNLGDRIRRYFDARAIRFEAKQMLGGLCFLVNDKMCVGVEKATLMARIGPDASDAALAKKGCHPMDFTGRPMRGVVFVDCEELASERELEFRLELALAFNPMVCCPEIGTKSRS